MEVLPYNDRFKGADWLKEMEYFSHSIIGLGGIGSHLSFQLARAGAKNLSLYDDDMVENHNIGGQLFSSQQVGDSKVFATKQIIEMLVSPEQGTKIYSNVRQTLSPMFQRFSNSSLFCCVDNMTSRRKLAEDFKRKLEGVTNNNSRVSVDKIYFESRLSPTGFEIFCLRNDKESEIDFYLENCLFTDEQATGLSCSFKQTTHVASALASKLVTIYTNYLTNIALNKGEKDSVRTNVDFFPVPFYYREDCNLLTKEINQDVTTYGK
jgi:molybdopterin/thiamine biosynthesis adenylyltransferase